MFKSLLLVAKLHFPHVGQKGIILKMYEYVLCIHIKSRHRTELVSVLNRCSLTGGSGCSLV